MFSFHSHAFHQPLQSKSAPVLVALINLVVQPFNAFDPHAELYLTCIEDFFAYILVIPLLPNRLPLSSLAFLTPRIPLQHLEPNSVPRIASNITTDDSRVNLIANLTAFAPVRYTTLPVQALAAYLHLTAEIMKSLPIHAFEPPERNAQPQLAWAEDDSESENAPLVEVVASFAPRRSLPQLDTKTKTRLQTLPSQAHINSILSATHKHTNPTIRSALFSWLHALSTIWPSRRDKIMGNVVAWSGGGLVRELYRGYVRSAPLGHGTNAAPLTGTSVLGQRTMCAY